MHSIMKINNMFKMCCVIFPSNIHIYSYTKLINRICGKRRMTLNATIIDNNFNTYPDS